MGAKPVETIMGAVVLLVAAVFLVFAYRTADLQAVEGYGLTARFNTVGGLPVGSDVRISGIKIGTVTGQTLDSELYQAVLTLSIRPDVALPEDTRARIASTGLLGGKYLLLDPGDAETVLADGDEIRRTEDFRSLEDTVGEIIFLATSDSGSDN